MSDLFDFGDAADTTEALAASLGGLTDLSKTFGQSLNSALKGAIVQGKSLDVVLRGIAERLASKALDQALSKAGQDWLWPLHLDENAGRVVDHPAGQAQPGCQTKNEGPEANTLHCAVDLATQAARVRRRWLYLLRDRHKSIQ